MNTEKQLVKNDLETPTSQVKNSKKNHIMIPKTVEKSKLFIKKNFR